MSNPLLQPILSSFHSRKPLRVGSLIVSIFGDAVLPHGEFARLSSLLAITNVIGVDEGAVRVAIHRLEKNGWLQRKKVGRAAYYALSEAGKAQSRQAAELIYAFDRPPPDENLKLLVLAEVSDRVKSRNQLAEAGWGIIAPNIALTTGTREQLSALETIANRDEHYLVKLAVEGDDIRNLCHRAWPLDSLNDAYREFVGLYDPILENSRKCRNMDGIEALSLRILLIHDYRRLILKDPHLLACHLPDNWQGFKAREIVSTTYANLEQCAQIGVVEMS